MPVNLGRMVLLVGILTGFVANGAPGQSPFDVLGIPHGASKFAAKRAYKKLALQYHPDKCAKTGHMTVEECSDKFNEAAEAFEAISSGREESWRSGKGNAGGSSPYNEDRHGDWGFYSDDRSSDFVFEMDSSDIFEVLGHIVGDPDFGIISVIIFSLVLSLIGLCSCLICAICGTFAASISVPVVLFSAIVQVFIMAVEEMT